ncbi:MAG TPA: glycosyltransferase family 4 protein [Rubrobacteraceae bacterium]|nr:glycosyltransferase family 4 protein [Rubrobacteraceae bacterium]
MKLLITHGYMFTGSGSNVYVQNLCRALVRAGHNVHLLCQEPRPLDYDFVDECYAVGEWGIERRGKQETPYAGRCTVYLPDIGDLLPVYVYDDYPGWRVKTFLDLTEEELATYVRSNVPATKLVLEDSGSEAVVTNHAVPGPFLARRALQETDVPYLSIVHGSALQYVARRSAFYFRMAREGLAGARHILAPSSHSTRTIEEDFPELTDRSVTLTGGVDTDLFRPEALDLRSLVKRLDGGPGRGPEQAAALDETLRSSQTAEDLAAGLRSIAASYEARAHDRDAGRRLGALQERDGPLVVYVGKLIHSKGVHSLLSAFVRVHRETGARLLVVGFGTFREGLEALVRALSTGDRRALELLADSGQTLEGGPSKPLKHFRLPEELVREAAGMEDYIEFVGPLGHRELAKLLPAADVAAVPSIFPESFGLVAAELAASGVPPFVADHSGLREAGGIVGDGLPFDPRVGLDNFEENLAHALTEYLGLPEKERAGYRDTVRRNSVERLSWTTLAEEVIALSGREG